MQFYIDYIGGKGDGVSSFTSEKNHRPSNTPVFIAKTLPGELVEALPSKLDRRQGSYHLQRIIRKSSDRIDPICEYFESCGGCAFQHWKNTSYQFWKRERVVDAVRLAGFPIEIVDKLICIHKGKKRRVDFTVQNIKNEISLGFRERGSHRLINIKTCPLLDPILNRLGKALSDPFTKLLAKGQKGRASANVLDNGIDLLITLPNEPNLEGLTSLAKLSEDLDLSRVTVLTPTLKDEQQIPVIMRRKPVIQFGEINVEPPAGTFLQATPESSEIITQVVLQGVVGAKRIADLFAGCGTLTFPLQKIGKVHAIEIDTLATTAIAKASAKAHIQNNISVEKRDLRKYPLLSGELRNFDALVIDPPRAGAKSQLNQIDADSPNTIVVVSCNPNTFQRDAHILRTKGYKLIRVLPIDQFLWSPHVELVAHFKRGVE